MIKGINILIVKCYFIGECKNITFFLSQKIKHFKNDVIHSPSSHGMFNFLGVSLFLSFCGVHLI